MLRLWQLTISLETAATLRQKFGAMMEGARGERASKTRITSHQFSDCSIRERIQREIDFRKSPTHENKAFFFFPCTYNTSSRNEVSGDSNITHPLRIRPHSANAR